MKIEKKMFKAQDIVGPGVHALDNQDEKNEKNIYMYDAKLQKLAAPISSDKNFFELSWLQFSSRNQTSISISSQLSSALFASWHLQAVFEEREIENKIENKIENTIENKIDAHIELFDQDNKTLTTIEHVCSKNNSIDFWACFPISTMGTAAGYKLLWNKTLRGTVKIVNNYWKLLDYPWICNPIRRRSFQNQKESKRSVLSDMMSIMYLLGTPERNQKWKNRLINIGVLDDQIKSLDLTTMCNTIEQKTRHIKSLKCGKCENVAWMFTDFCEPNANLTWSTWEQEFWILFNSISIKNTAICFSGQYSNVKEQEVPLPSSPLHPINMSTLAAIVPWNEFQEYTNSFQTSITLAQWLNSLKQVVRPNVSLVEYYGLGN